MDHKETCPECGCQCSRCDPHALHLHREIESLKQLVIERDFHILRLETTVLREAERFPHGEVGELRSQLGQWQDKYDRLLESYRKLQRVNQNLEDKLLRIVDKYESDKSALGQDVANLTTHLVSARTDLTRHRDLSERYRNDLHLAIQLLQCKPSTFISRRLETLPVDLQQKVKSCLNTHQKEARKPDFKVIKVPISTFPPTAMVYAVDKASDGDEAAEPDVAEDERVSAAILARVLEERERERSASCVCGRPVGTSPLRLVDVAVQTRASHIGDRDALAQPFVYELAASEPVAIRQTVVIGRGRAPASPPGWWPPPADAAAAAAETAWDNNFDFSPPRSTAGSAGSLDSAATGGGGGSGGGAGAGRAASLRMETRI